jgi:hypothetical protein
MELRTVTAQEKRRKRAAERSKRRNAPWATYYLCLRCGEVKRDHPSVFRAFCPDCED